MKEEDINKLQNTVWKLEERLAKLEEAFGAQQAVREATAVNTAREATQASIRNLEME